MRQLFAVLIAVVCLAGVLSAEPIVKSGDRFVFLGDSITEQQIYTRFVMDYFALRYPGENITFRNVGWSGDTSPGGLARLERDVLSQKPNVVSICFGMNDAGYTTFEEGRFDRYISSMKGTVSDLRKAGVRVVLLTPGCIDPDKNVNLKEKDYNSTLRRFADGVLALAKDENLPVYDIHALMIDVQTRAKADDPNFTMIPDSVHPNDFGHIVMAYGLLKALGCTKQPSSLAINVGDRSFTAEGCIVSELIVSADSVRFIRTDDALPMFFNRDAQRMLRYVPMLEEISDYSFKVTGLGEGQWKLTVDSAEVGVFSATDLSKGINLTTYPGPWLKLGEELDRLILNQEQMYFARWRNISSASWLMDEAKRQLEPIGEEFDRVIAEWETDRIEKAGSNRTWEWRLVRQQ